MSRLYQVKFPTKSSITSICSSDSFSMTKLDSDHLHQRFVDGLFSDITVKAFNREWKLHKVTLSGSPYFMSLFTKGWKESSDQVVQLQIPDQKVTAEVLNACFQSLYTDEIELDESNVIRILAAASFLQMHDLIQNCAEFMVESINKDNAIDFYKANIAYGGGETVENACLTILQNYICCPSLVNQFPRIDTKLMAKIIESSQTICIEESSLYVILIKWLYMKVTGSNFDNAKDKDQTTQAFNYFRQLKGSIPFLSTKEGKPYVEAFRQIRIKDLFSSLSIFKLQEVNVIPHEWIRDAATENWKLIENGIGFKRLSNLNVKLFDKLCTRQGLLVVENGKPESREFRNSLTGMQLNWIMARNNRVFQIKRFAGKLDAKPNEARDYFVRTNLVVTGDYSQGQIKFSKISEIKKVSLKMGESLKLLEIGSEFDKDVIFIGINYCLL